MSLVTTPTAPLVQHGGDPAEDPATLAEIMQLNQHIAQTGEPIEGGICYFDQTAAADYVNAPPVRDIDHVRKRMNLASLARRGRTMLEVGVNGGHSALICLMANPKLHLFCVDLCMHGYTAHAANYLKARFGRRFHFRPGDSREVLPSLALDRPSLRFDLLHIDGGHTPGIAMADISNAVRMAAPGASMVIDDINASVISDVVELVINLGHLAPLRDRSGLVDTELHDVYEVT